ncbi:hypothetical protein ANN_28005, partial [Periplaneta americana]
AGAGGDTAVHVNSASPARLTAEGQHHADNNESRGRKRTKNEEILKRNLRKKLRNNGKALKVEKDLHLASVEQARGSMRSDEGNACNEMYVATFDLQKALPFPKLTTSTAYYKRNMYVYNFGIHSFINPRPLCICGMKQKDVEDVKK